MFIGYRVYWLTAWIYNNCGPLRSFTVIRHSSFWCIFNVVMLKTHWSSTSEDEQNNKIKDCATVYGIQWNSLRFCMKESVDKKMQDKWLLLWLVDQTSQYQLIRKRHTRNSPYLFVTNIDAWEIDTELTKVLVILL